MQKEKRKVRNPYIGHEAYHCFGCDPDNRTGLRLEFFVEGESVVSYWHPSEAFEGYPGVVHGGIQATIADEIAGWYLHAMKGIAGVTKEITVKYHKPARITAGPLRIVADARDISSKQAVVEVSIFDNTDVLCSSSECHYAIFSDAVARKRLHFPGREAFISHSDH